MKEETQITIKLQLYAWIASSIGEEDTAGTLVDKKVKAGSTLAEFLAGLAASHENFRQFVFDPATNAMNDEVVIVLNNKLVQFKDIKDTVLKDQDIITLSPVLVGG